MSAKVGRIGNVSDDARDDMVGALCYHWVCSLNRWSLVMCPRQIPTTHDGSDAGWSSPVARWAHNPKVAGSNPAPATNLPPTVLHGHNDQRRTRRIRSPAGPR